MLFYALLGRFAEQINIQMKYYLGYILQVRDKYIEIINTYVGLLKKASYGAVT